MLPLFIVDNDDGGGGGDVDNEIDPNDFIIEDDETEAGGEENKKDEGSESPPEESEKKSALLDEETLKELEELKEFKDEITRKQAIIDATNELKQEHPDFDLEKVTAKLKEIHKKNPQEAERLNNPTGWEVLHLKYFKSKSVEADPFDAGRGARENFDFKKTQELALSGDKRALAALMRHAK